MATALTAATPNPVPKLLCSLATDLYHQTPKPSHTCRCTFHIPAPKGEKFLTEALAVVQRRRNVADTSGISLFDVIGVLLEKHGRSIGATIHTAQPAIQHASPWLQAQIMWAALAAVDKHIGTYNRAYVELRKAVVSAEPRRAHNVALNTFEGDADVMSQAVKTMLDCGGQFRATSKTQARDDGSYEIDFEVEFASLEGAAFPHRRFAHLPVFASL